MTLYQLDDPVDTALPADLQASMIFDHARLMSCSVGADSLAGVEDPEVYHNQTISHITQIRITGDREKIKAGLLRRLRSFVDNGYQLENYSDTWNIRGESRYFKSNYYGLLEDGFLKQLVIFHRDETAARHQEELVANIAQNLAADCDEAFFIQLVRRLAQTFDLDYAAISEVADSGSELGADGEDDAQVRMLAFYSKDSPDIQHQEVVYSLRDSPGFDVLAGKAKIYASGVREQFPGNEALRNSEIDGYIGVPILGENSQHLGLMSLMHKSAIPNPDLVKAVLNIFSIRASAEIERRRANREQQQRQLQQRIFIDNNTSGMFVVDIAPPMPMTLNSQKQVQWLAEHSQFVDANQAFLDLFECKSLADLLGRSLFGGCVAYDFATTARSFIGGEYQFRDHLIRLNLGDKDIWVSANCSSVVENQQLVQLLGMVTDISDRVRHSQEVEYRAQHDALTDLPNRSYFIDQLEQARRLSRPGSRHALFLLDLDGFKEVNDTLGHETGDYLLQQIGPRVSRLLAPTKSLLARLGGDEFAIFVENYQDIQTVLSLARDLIQAIKSPFTINELELVVGGSIGISLYPDNADSVSSLMRCADVAMYQAKKNAIDYCLYSTQQDHYTVRRLSLMMDIRHAIGNDELRLFYQPIVSLHDQKPVSFEALIRWEHPVLGILPPLEFIPLIELTDMIMPVTWWVLETAIEQLAVWKARNWPYKISVNVSARNLVDAGFVSFIENCLQRYGVNGEFLEIEITESTLMADPEKARRLLQSVAALGASISIDDYGTGYSSLAYLKSLPINTLKIDRTFISQMLEDSQDIIIVNSTIQLAHNLGLDVTAEGIEEPSLVNALVDLGCDKGQGYFFCRPIPVNELEQWLLLHSRATVCGQN